RAHTRANLPRFPDAWSRRLGAAKPQDESARDEPQWPEAPMKGTEAVARRYARAALDVALAKGESGLGEDLDALARLYETSAELRTALLHPAIPAEKKTAVVGALWPGRRPELLLRLVGLLAQRERIELLPLVARAYGRLWNAHRGVVEAEAVS